MHIKKVMQVVVVASKGIHAYQARQGMQAIVGGGKQVRVEAQLRHL